MKWLLLVLIRSNSTSSVAAWPGSRDVFVLGDQLSSDWTDAIFDSVFGSSFIHSENVWTTERFIKVQTQSSFSLFQLKKLNRSNEWWNLWNSVHQVLRNRWRRPDGRAVNALVEFFPASFWRSTKVVIMWSIWEAFAQHSQFLCQVPSLMLIRSGRVGSGRASVAPGTPQQFTLNQQINYNSARLHELVCPITTTVTQNVTSVLTGRHIGHSVGGGASFSPMKAAQCCMKTGRPPPVLQLRAWALETSCLAPGSSRLSKCHWTECLQLWQ